MVEKPIRGAALRGGVLRGVTVLLVWLMMNGAARAQPSATVPITFRVDVPESVPAGEAVYWSGSLNRWDPGPEGIGQHPWAEEVRLAPSGGEWRITLAAPRGDTLRYRYTRGSAFSVEGRAQGGVRPRRKVVADRPKTVTDTVAAWRDLPESSKADSWFKVRLEAADPAAIRQDGEPMRYSGTVLYAADRVREFFRGYVIDDRLRQVPTGLTDTTLYIRRMSDAPAGNAVRALAGRTAPGAPWRIYVDANNDARITPDEQTMTVPPDTAARLGTIVTFDYNVQVDGALQPRTTKARLEYFPDPPAVYVSSRREAPTLVLSPEVDLREGAITLPDTTVQFAVYRTHVGHGIGWRGYHDVLVDQNGDGVYDRSAGSDEHYPFRTSFQLGYLDLEVADIDTHGRWVKLRPAASPVTARSMQPGDAAPDWEAPVFEGVPHAASDLQGRYVLLDFWATWCAPCISELPTLRRAYERFQGAPFMLIGVVHNDTRANVERLRAEREIPWTQAFDRDGVIADTFRVNGIPDPILIGPGGQILHRGDALRGARLVQTLSTYLE